MEVSSKCLSYEGPFGVGYGICIYEISGRNPARNFKDQYEEQEREKVRKRRDKEDAYVRMARKTIEEYVFTGSITGVLEDYSEKLPEEMTAKRAGVFVSIKKEGRLRGCIGTIQAVQVSITVDVLGDTEKIDSADKLDVKRYGVVVTRGHRRGLLLPNLDGVDTVEEQIAIAKQKAGIPEEEDVSIERFEVERHIQ